MRFSADAAYLRFRAPVAPRRLALARSIVYGNRSPKIVSAITTGAMHQQWMKQQRIAGLHFYMLTPRSINILDAEKAMVQIVPTW